MSDLWRQCQFLSHLGLECPDGPFDYITLQSAAIDAMHNRLKWLNELEGDGDRGEEAQEAIHCPAWQGWIYEAHHDGTPLNNTDEGARKILIHPSKFLPKNQVWVHRELIERKKTKNTQQSNWEPFFTQQ